MVVEKTPIHVLSLGYLLRHYPNSKFINMFRDGRDCYVSMRSLEGYGNISLARYASLWKKCVTKRINVGQGDKILDVKYEDLVGNPRKVLSQITEFLGEYSTEEQLNPKCSIQATANFRKIKGHEKLANNIIDRSVGKWKVKMTELETKKFYRIARKSLKILIICNS